MPSLAVRRFADRVAAHSGRCADDAEFAVGAGTLLESLLDNDHVLEAAEREPAEDRYRQHVLHVDPAGRFSVVALVWLPGQGTPIHDHLAWCVSGVLTGAEYERRYTLADGVLVEGDAVLNRAGEVSVLTSGPDIHQVACCDDRLTISLHVYGTDVTRTGSSVNRTFAPALPVVGASRG